jgi:hypothetical protein
MNGGIMYRVIILICIVSSAFLSCDRSIKDESTKLNNFVYIGNLDNDLIFLDSENGKIVFINNYRIIKYIDMNMDAQQITEIVKENISENINGQSFREINFSGFEGYNSLRELLYEKFNMKFSSGIKLRIIFRMSIRYYDGQLLYKIDLIPSNPYTSIASSSDEWGSMPDDFIENQNKYKREVYDVINYVIMDKNVRVKLLDNNGFILEEIYPHFEEGLIPPYQSIGRMKMKLDNYLEVKNWDVEFIY